MTDVLKSILPEFPYRPQAVATVDWACILTPTNATGYPVSSYPEQLPGALGRASPKRPQPAQTEPSHGGYTPQTFVKIARLLKMESYVCYNERP